MKVSQQLNVSDQEFYNTLVTSLAKEIEITTGKSLKPHKGLAYTSELVTYAKNKREVRTKITELTENKCYEAQFEYGQGINSVRFDIDAIDPTKVNVTYEEGFVGSSGKVQANYGLVSFFVKPFNKRKAKKKLKAMETYIINNREN